MKVISTLNDKNAHVFSMFCDLCYGDGTLSTEKLFLCLNTFDPLAEFYFLYLQAPAGTYSGMYDVYKHLMKTEGITALYKGFTPVMLRAFPANAVSTLNWDLIVLFNFQ